MRYFFNNYIPDFQRILLVESGSRALLNEFIPRFAREYAPHCRIDLVTCFADVPTGFTGQGGTVYDVADYAGREGRQRLYEKLRTNDYDIIGIICAEEPIMTKWKWALAWQVPAKLFLLNENGDFFWFDISNWRIIWQFIIVRAGLSGAGAVTTVGRLFLFPFTLLYLSLFAAAVHLRRKVRA